MSSFYILLVFLLTLGFVLPYPIPKAVSLQTALCSPYSLSQTAGQLSNVHSTAHVARPTGDILRMAPGRDQFTLDIFAVLSLPF